MPVERDTLYNVVREHPRAALPEAALKVRDRKAARSTWRWCRERRRHASASPPSGT